MAVGVAATNPARLRPR
jgi:hypothetical protein